MPSNPSTGSPEMPGTLLGYTRDGIHVQCGEGTVLEILQVQKPAKSVVSGREYANGARLHPGELIFQ
jgi:methionyl-tRNA formyltransferase